MKRYALPLLLMVVFCSAERAAAQIGGGHTVFGDLKVDESKAAGPVSQTFHVLLYTASGNMISRLALPANGRYRFFNVTNGEYYIAIEVDNQEVARVMIFLAEREKTDIRRDIELEWRGAPGASESRKPGLISAADIYKRDPANNARFEKAMEAIKKKEDERAISLLEEIVGADPKDFEAWTEMGTLRFKKNSVEEAEKFYHRALEAQPSYIVALLNFGKLQMARKDFERAIETFSKAVQTHPTSSDANYFLGESYLQIKKGSKAVGYLNEAIRLDPVGKAEAHLRLAALYNGAGLKDMAAIEYEQFLAKKPNYPEKKKLQQYIKENKKP